MRFGPTSMQVASVLAKGLRRPKLRSDLRISEQTVAGETSYVVKVQDTRSYNRYGKTEYEILSLCDGTRTAADISNEMNERHPDEPLAETEVMDFLESVEAAMWERSVGEKNLAVLERIRDERKSRIDQSSMLYISFKAWNPNKTLAKLDPYFSWMYTRGFVIFSVALFITVAYLLAGDWTRIQQDTSALYSFANKSAYDIWVFWLLLLGLGCIHEFGHGLTCKHFGGDVHQMGFLLIYFTPAFFTDTTDILLFPEGSRRQWVIFAGIWVELVICGLAALVWHFTLPGSTVNDLAYKTMLLSGIQGAVLNLNPLIKADGYYALSQFLDIDNLREDSFAFLRAFGRKYLLFQDVELPTASKRQRRIFLIFGLTAITYSTTLLVLVVLWAKNIFVTKFGVWGYLLTLGVIYFFARKGLKKALPTIRAWLRTKREEYMAWKITRVQQVGLAGVALLFLLPPAPMRITTDLVLEPGNEARIRTETGGSVARIFVRQGDSVKQGQLLAVLENPELEADARVVKDELALTDSELRRYEGTADLDKAARAARERAQLQQELDVAQARVARLEIRAPIAGAVTTPQIEQRVGEFLAPGDEFCRLADRTTIKARILVRDWELDDVNPGAKALVKVVPFPYRTFSGQVDRVLPAAALDRPTAETQRLKRLGQDLTNYFAVEMVFANPDGILTEGMTGTAKITCKSHSLAWQAGRGGWRWIRSYVWW
jgi:putative peptide zinc metalloprotease protein